MIAADLAEFRAALPETGPLLGLDLGTETIGVAISDGFRSVASPLETIRRKRFQRRVEALGGYSTERTGTLIAV